MKSSVFILHGLVAFVEIATAKNFVNKFITGSRGFDAPIRIKSWTSIAKLNDRVDQSHAIPEHRDLNSQRLSSNDGGFQVKHDFEIEEKRIKESLKQLGKVMKNALSLTENISKEREVSLTYDAPRADAEESENSKRKIDYVLQKVEKELMVSLERARREIERVLDDAKKVHEEAMETIKKNGENVMRKAQEDVEEALVWVSSEIERALNDTLGVSGINKKIYEVGLGGNITQIRRNNDAESRDNEFGASLKPKY